MGGGGAGDGGGVGLGGGAGDGGGVVLKLVDTPKHIQDRCAQVGVALVCSWLVVGRFGMLQHWAMVGMAW